MPRSSQLVGVDELEARLGRADWRVVDCRFDLMNPDAGRAAYEAGHIPGAVYAHLDRDLAAPVGPHTGRHPLPDRATFIDTLRRWGISNATRVVPYDDGNGALAARLWWLLRWTGHAEVAVLDGGYAAWQRAGKPVSTEEPRPREGRFDGGAPLTAVLDTEALAGRLGEPDAPVLVDARDPARFAGKTEPIDAVAGHVPGALNFPFARNIAEDGRWLPPAELRRRWQVLFDGDAPADWAVMCGSGVTACHLALSAELAGLAGPRLYAGSWSEWIRDPGRPVAGSSAGRRPPAEPS